MINMFTSRKVLDHGFVTVHNLCGPTRRPDAAFDADSTDPANTARMSFGAMNSGRTREQDLKLVNYLITNSHNTPVEMIECYFEMKLPIFVARQFVRHRTSCINEISGRYVQLPAQFYVPETVGSKSTNGAKQGQSNNFTAHDQEILKSALKIAGEEAFKAYQSLLDYGVAPEHARMVLPLNTYTHWMWKQDLHNMLHFLRFRLHPHAQIEARLYAQAVLELLRQHLPEIMDIAIPEAKFEPGMRG